MRRISEDLFGVLARTGRAAVNRAKQRRDHRSNV
jgi:hypothetical protein